MFVLMLHFGHSVFEQEECTQSLQVSEASHR